MDRCISVVFLMRLDYSYHFAVVFLSSVCRTFLVRGWKTVLTLQSRVVVERSLELTELFCSSRIHATEVLLHADCQRSRLILWETLVSEFSSSSLSYHLLVLSSTKVQLTYPNKVFLWRDQFGRWRERERKRKKVLKNMPMFIVCCEILILYLVGTNEKKWDLIYTDVKNSHGPISLLRTPSKRMLLTTNCPHHDD